jgi:hypothetical protein
MASINKHAENYLNQTGIKFVWNYNPDTGILMWNIDPGGAVLPGDVAGTKHHTGYLITHYNGYNYMVHRIAWIYIHGTWPQQDIDHINGDRSDNRIKNLRDVTRSENCRNRKAESSISGVTGVHYDPQKVCWRARIYHNNKLLSLGSFTYKEEAVEVRKEAEKLYGHHPNHGRKEE